MFRDFKELVDRLQATTSRLEKEAILASYKDNETVKAILKFVFNPYIVTGISKKKIHKFADSEIFMQDLTKFNSVKEFLEYFTTHCSGRDVDILVLKQFVCAQEDDYKDIVNKIIMKDVKVGVQPATLNKVFGKGFIETFDVMLGSKYYDNPDKLVKDGELFILTQKLDGVRCVCIREGNDCKFFSRQGQPIYDLTQIQAEALAYLPEGYVYDGELLLENKDGLESKDLYRATVKVTSSDGLKTNVIFNCFDMLPIDAFKEGVWKVDAATRKTIVENTMRKYPMKWIKEVPVLYMGDNKERITEYLDKIVDEGGEGVMINLANSPYECKRSLGLLKVKKMQTCDIRCVAVVEGTGQNAHSLGAVTCQFEGPDGNIYSVNVGSGFTLTDRAYIWNNPSVIVGKIIEVQYFEISQNEQGGYSLRFPVFKHIREDKSEISMN